MKPKILLLLGLLFLAKMGHAQNSINALIQKISSTKDDDTKVDIIANALLSTSEADPRLTLKSQQAILAYAVKNKDAVSEAMAMGGVGYSYRHFGSNDKSLQYAINGYNIAEETGNQKAICCLLNLMGNCYKDIGNYTKATELYKKLVDIAQSINYVQAMGWGLENLTEVFILINQYDSALVYAQKDYETQTRIHKNVLLSYTLINLAAIHGKMGNKALAKTYYDMAIAEAVKNNSPKEINWAYASKADYFRADKEPDSAMITAKLAIDAVNQTPFANYALKPAKLLLDMYRTQNADSAFKYGEIYHNAKDSLFSAQVISQAQALTFESDMREEKLAQERGQNIQYALIALGIIIFITLFLLLSRTIIVNERLISFFAILGLLVVFEFINLLIHPWLASFTHESPVLMLLALVIIASLLIPLHHRLEHWTKEKMIAKNKAIRLAAAKKTIAKLEADKQ